MKIKIKQTFRSMWATILAVLMLLSTFSAVAVTLNDMEGTGGNISGGTVYFKVPDDSWNNFSYIYMSQYQGGYSYLTRMTRITNTNLYYTTAPDHSGWNDESVYFFAVNSSWGSSSFDTGNSSMNKYTAKYTQSMSNGNYYLYTPSSTSNGSALTVSSNTSVTSLLNKTVTLKTMVSTDGGSTYTENDSTLSAISVSGYSFGSTNSTSVSSTAKDIAVDTASSSANTTSALSTSVSMTASSVKDGYEFAGWGTSASSPTQTETSYSYTVGGASTVYAFYKTTTAPSKTYYVFGEVSNWTPGDTDNHIAIDNRYNGEEGKFYGIIPSVDSGKYFAITDGTNQYGPENNNSKPNTEEFVNTKKESYQSWKTDQKYEPLYVIIDTNGTGNPTVKFATSLSSTYTVNTGVKISTNGTEFTVDSTKEAPTGGGDITGSTTLEAKSIDGYTFVGWEVTAGATISSDSMSVSYTPTADTTVYAKYKALYSITITQPANGSITINPTATTNVVAGTSVQFTASPEDGYVFVAWTDDLSSETSASVTKTVTSNLTVSATFKKAPYTVTLTPSPSAGGSITGKIGTSEDLTNLEGTQTISLTASANTGYKFKEWQVTGTATIADKNSAETTATVTDACTITAVFEEIPKVATSVTLTAEPTTVEKNDPITLTATLNTPATGAENITYKFEKTSGSTGNFSGNVENTTSTTATFTPTATGTYNFKVTASCDGFTSVTSDVISVTVTEPVNYYLGGRISTSSGNLDNWGNDSNKTTLPFTKVDGQSKLYYFNTGKTVSELSDTYNGNSQYFFIHTGTGSKVANQWFGLTGGVFTTSNKSVTLVSQSGTSTDNAVGLVKFNSAEDKSGPVTLYFNSSTKELYYTVPEAVKYPIEKIGTNIDKFDTKVNSVSVTEASAGATVTIEINPEAGYEVATVQVVQIGTGDVEGDTVEVVGEGNTRTFVMPESKVTVNVTFKLKEYTMNGVANPNNIGGSVTPSVPTANMGATVTFTATPVDGYNVSWNVTGVEQSAVTISGNTATVIVGTADVTATANYEGNLFTVTKNLSSNGSYTVTGIDSNNQAMCGSTVTINPTPDSGYALDTITVRKFDGTPVTVTDNTFRMPNGDVTITVTFKSNPGTATDYKFLYNSSSSASNMTVIKGTVYENPTNTYTLTITDTDVISNIVNNSNAYFALSSTTNYTGIFTKNNDKTKVKTGTTDYVGNQWPQNNHEGGIPYYYAGVSFKDKNSIKKIVLIFENSATAPTYTVNAYATSSDKTPLADGVTLTANPTTQTIGKKVALTATLNNVNEEIPQEAEFTYTFYCGSDVLDTKTVTNGQSPVVATYTVSSNTVGTKSYTVTVSTKESNIQNYTPTDYESVTSDIVNVEYRDVIYYYAAVNPETGAVDTRNAIPADNKVETTVSDGGTYYFSVFDNDTDTSPESVVDYTVDSANNRYCTISKSSTETGLDYLIVKCNAKCSNPVIYFDKANKTVYAVATQNIGSSKTLNSDKKVTYYFAEERYDSTTKSDPAAGGNGMRIKYWNNSVDNSEYADVTTPVNVAGIDKDGKATNCNSIFVRVDKFAGISSTDIPSEWNNHLQREFYIYSVELPIWATSFNFVSSSNTALTVDNTSQTGNSSCSSIVLNPNRIYCLFYNGTKNFVRGVVLDESFWNNTERGALGENNTNEVATQGFASNLVNYDTKTDNDKFNKELTAQYGSGYEHPLYFKSWYYDNVDTDSATMFDSTYFKLHDNLAMRYKEPDSFYASIQNLTDNRLSTTKKNEMGNGYLLGYNGILMPEFNYEMLKSNSTLVYSNQLYENVQFPFYASTFDGVTTYSYDSTTDRNRVVDTSGSSPTIKVSGGFVKKGSSYGYFPFGGGDNTTYGSGTEFDINFYMTNNGKLSNGDDIAFNFSGDDDVWVYVDGVRVLDLGGAHSVSSGTINFSDMKVYYKTAANATDNVKKCKDSWSIETEYVKTVSLTDLFEANGVSFSNTDASTQHTLQMFYLERGEGESNCSISFNLPQNTGFRVNSNVTTDSVNDALVKDTMTAANKDYFNYQIANKLATATEYTNVSTKFANTPARAENVNGLTPSTAPSYPIKSLLISREFLGTNYYLTATNATPSDSNNGWLNSVNNSTFTNLQNVNYTLSDAYAVKGTSDTESSPTGRVSGTGIFNLLFGQSAIFESKIPNNTMIQLSQDDIIRKVNAGDGDTTVITAGDASTRTVSNYYSSSYSIVDDNTGLELANKTQSVTDGKLYANDASANSNMFYFANYSGETNTSSNAMTVTYTNDVLTSKIKLAKSVQNPSATDNFYFKVEFSKIFGETFASSKEYTDLQYKVYNSDGDSLVATRTYGKAGVYFTANQYAIIEGVPVDSAYNVVEKDRAGYKFVNASKTTYNDTTEVATVPDLENSVDGKTVSGAAGTTTYDEITFKNSKQAFTVNFKYYDRSVITGTTSRISTTPTTVTYSYATLDGYTADDAGQTKFKLENLIIDAYAHYKNFDNVIDTYKIYTSQTAAEDSNNGAGSLTVLREGIDGVTAGVTTYSTAYGNINGVDLGLHYDCYGRPQGTADCIVSDKEDWVTYYAGNTPISQTDAEKADSGVNSITVWLYNAPKKYMPTFYYASKNATSGELQAVTGTDRYVAKTTQHTILNNVYYNVRLGNANGNAQNDAATDYLKEYGISKGYCEEVPNIVTDVNYDNKSLKFLYWASDPSGKTILSTDVAYGYRVTNNLKAYAVYGVNDFNAKGLTITPNTPDYYSNSTGKSYIRLNNVMNVYGCPERDRNIKNSSIIYIIDYSTADGDGKTQMDKLIDAGGFDELQAKVREVLKANEGSKNFVEGNNIAIEAEEITFTKNSNGDIDITGFNHKVVPYNEALNPGTDDIKLTNKNRVQFTTSFTKSNLKDLKMYAMLGMDYSELVSGKNDGTNSWIVSDNLLYYEFDTSGNVTSIKDPILKYTFYTAS